MEKIGLLADEFQKTAALDDEAGRFPAEKIQRLPAPAVPETAPFHKRICLHLRMPQVPLTPYIPRSLWIQNERQREWMEKIGLLADEFQKTAALDDEAETAPFHKRICLHLRMPQVPLTPYIPRRAVFEFSPPVSLWIQNERQREWMEKIGLLADEFQKTAALDDDPAPAVPETAPFHKRICLHLRMPQVPLTPYIPRRAGYRMNGRGNGWKKSACSQTNFKKQPRLMMRRAVFPPL
jgi:hypothetical protein